MSRFVVLFGPPGVGKGTQAALLKDALKVPHISTGDMFRDHKKRQTDLGKRVEAILAAGDLVPDSVTNDMVRDRVAQPDAKVGALLDGYPRNPAQAQVLDGILQEAGARVDDVVVLEAPRDELVERLLNRGKGSGRADDQDPDVIKNRLNVYGEQSEPCIEYYERTGKRVHHIDGFGTIEEVKARILKALGVAR
jgi:adenylate kinase